MFISLYTRAWSCPQRRRHQSQQQKKIWRGTTASKNKQKIVTTRKCKVERYGIPNTRGCQDPKTETAKGTVYQSYPAADGHDEIQG